MHTLSLVLLLVIGPGQRLVQGCAWLFRLAGRYPVSYRYRPPSAGHSPGHEKVHEITAWYEGPSSGLKRLSCIEFPCFAPLWLHGSGHSGHPAWLEVLLPTLPGWTGRQVTNPVTKEVLDKSGFPSGRWDARGPTSEDGEMVCVCALTGRLG